MKCGTTASLEAVTWDLPGRNEGIYCFLEQKGKRHNGARKHSESGIRVWVQPEVGSRLIKVTRLTANQGAAEANYPRMDVLDSIGAAKWHVLWPT